MNPPIVMVDRIEGNEIKSELVSVIQFCDNKKKKMVDRIGSNILFRILLLFFIEISPNES